MPKIFANHSDDKGRFSHQREQAEGAGMVVIHESEGLSVCGVAGMHSLTLSLLFLSVSPLFSHCFPKHLFNRIFTTPCQYITFKKVLGELRGSSHSSCCILSSTSGWRNIQQVTWAYIFFLIKGISSFQIQLVFSTYLPCVWLFQ